VSSDPVLAYQDESFLNSDAGRPLRILAEYLQPLQAFQRQRVHDTIVFFGSARLREGGPLGRYYAEARELARLVTEWSLSLPCDAHRFIVCSGGGGGIMEAANRGAADAGGRTIGLDIGLPHEQRPNRYITPGLGFEFHYFLHAQALVRPPRPSNGGVSRRPRNTRRAVRDPDSVANPKTGSADPVPPLWPTADPC